jgi:hypothetical protein
VRPSRWLYTLASPLLPALLASGPALATSLTFSTDAIGQYLLIGMGPVNDVGDAVGVGQASNTNNFELGANKAPVPSTDDFLDGGSSGGPSLDSAVPALPSNIEPVPQGITGDGNVAITHEDGVFNFQDVGLYGDLGVRCAAGSAADCDDGTQNSFYNDPNQFPNTFNVGTQTGNTVNPGDADQTTRIDDPNLAGVTANVDFSILLGDLADANAEIAALASTSVLDVSAAGGTIKPDTFDDVSVTGPVVLSTVGATTLVITANSAGLHVIDIETGGSDFKLENANLVIDGPAGAVFIFRLPDDGSGTTNQNMLVANANILVGDGGIGLNSVLFYSNRPESGTHFSFSNTVLNGVAFWTLANEGGEINVSNGQGCTQFVSDKITLNDVRFARCAFVPEPRGTGLVAVGLAAVALASSGWGLRRRARG